MSNAVLKDYAYEICGYCQGEGAVAGESLCPPCKGKGKVIVLQPPLQCPRCGGDGKAKGPDRVLYYSERCVICGGTGWVMSLEQSSE